MFGELFLKFILLCSFDMIGEGRCAATWLDEKKKFCLNVKVLKKKQDELQFGKVVLINV